MPRIFLVIVTGQPCTGKTTLGRRLAQDLHLPFIAKDDIKETLFDTLGMKDRAWSKLLGNACYALLIYFVEQELRAERNVMIEGNFPASMTLTFQTLQAQYSFYAIQILCYADDEILMRRFKARSESGERHPGHVDHENYAEFQERLAQGPLQPLGIDGRVIRVNANDFTRVDYIAALHEIQSLIPSL